jgi:hypothetical protein
MAGPRGEFKDPQMKRPYPFKDPVVGKGGGDNGVWPRKGSGD